jgi:hypothetical protein
MVRWTVAHEIIDAAAVIPSRPRRAAMRENFLRGDGLVKALITKRESSESQLGISPEIAEETPFVAVKFSARQPADESPMDTGRQLLLGRDEAVDDDFGDAFEDLVAEVRVFVAEVAKARAVEEHHFGGFERARLEFEIVRRKKPGPAEDIAVANGLNGRASLAEFRFDRYFASDEQVESIGGIAFAEDHVPGVEVDAHGAGRQGFKMHAAQTG